MTGQVVKVKIILILELSFSCGRIRDDTWLPVDTGMCCLLC